MRNTVSLHKACIAKFSGLLVLAALAVVFFVTPMAMAMGGGCATPTPRLPNNVKVFFLGKVASAPTTVDLSLSATNSKLPLALNQAIKPTDVAFGSWFMCAVKSPSNTFYIFTCSVTSFRQNNRVTSADVNNNNVAVTMGLPANTAATAPGAMKYVGEKGLLLYTINAAGLLTPSASVEQALKATGTGW